MDLNRIITRLLGLSPPGRNVEVYPDDVFIVSYPRSGNTWLRFLVGNLVHTGPVDFRNIDDVISDIYQKGKLVIKTHKPPRFLKSHETFDHRYPKVVYLVRDPRDVCVSYYHYHLKNRWFDENVNLNDFVADFLQGNIRGNFGSWGENVGSWLGAGFGKSNFLLIRYEDLHEDTMEELIKVADFIGINSSKEQLEEAITRSNLDNMRKLEQEQFRDWSTTRGSDPKIPFIRVADVGGWRKELSEDLRRSIEHEWNDLMGKLRYLPSVGS